MATPSTPVREASGEYRSARLVSVGALPNESRMRAAAATHQTEFCLQTWPPRRASFMRWLGRTRVGQKLGADGWG